MRTRAWAAAFAAVGFVAGFVPTHTATASTIDVGATVAFSGGFGPNLFTIENTSNPGGNIGQVQINLGAGMIFDTALGGLGTGLAFPFQAVSGVVGTVTPNVVDGAGVLSIDFTDFQPGETFAFSVDVDNLAPSGFLLALLRTFVTGGQFAGSTVDITFVGDTIFDTTLSGTFVANPAGFPLIAGGAAAASVEGQALITPEPGSIAMWSILGVAAFFGRRRVRRGMAQTAA